MIRVSYKLGHCLRGSSWYFRFISPHFQLLDLLILHSLNVLGKAVSHISLGLKKISKTRLIALFAVHLSACSLPYVSEKYFAVDRVRSCGIVYSFSFPSKGIKTKTIRNNSGRIKILKDEN